MPAPIHFAHRILRRLARARHDGSAPLLGPDAKSQVTLAYENERPVRAASIVVSTQHDGGIGQDEVAEIVRPHVEAALPEGWMCPDDAFHVNPTGRFEIGGAGRRLRAYRAQDRRRYLWRRRAPWRWRLFRQGPQQWTVRRPMPAAIWPRTRSPPACRPLRIQLSYAIGLAHPLSLHVETYGTCRIDEAKLEEALMDAMALTPRGIRDRLGLDRPIYERTAAYGHFGREVEADGGFPGSGPISPRR